MAQFNLNRAQHIKIVETKEKKTFIPHIVEPSIGIDRLCYAVLQQNLMYRDQEDIKTIKEENKRIVLTLNSRLSLFDCAIFNQNSKIEGTREIYQKIVDQLQKSEKRIYLETSTVGIGKSYVRADELGIEKCITIDALSVKDNTVTVRDRDTMAQVRVSLEELTKII